MKAQSRIVYATALFVVAVLIVANPRPALADPPPVPSPQATSCAVGDPNRPAHVITQSPLVYPYESAMFKGTVTITVSMEISATGVVTKADVVKSSGDVALDNAALDAAELSTYAPAIVDCKAVAGTFMLQGSFKSPY